MKSCPVCLREHERKGIYCDSRCAARVSNARQRGTPLRPRIFSFDCAQCGKTCVPGQDVVAHASKFCSRQCKIKWHHIHSDGQKTKMQRALDRLNRPTEEPRYWVEGPCLWCSQRFLGKRGTDYCSPDCKRRAKNRRMKEGNRAYVRSLKACGCTKCGAKPEPDQLHFHHLDPATKTATVSKLTGQGRTRIDREVAKCVVLCRPCHTAEHL